MPTIYETSAIHGVETVAAQDRGICGPSICVQIVLGSASGEVTVPMFFPTSAEDEARRVVAALNGKAPAVSVGGLLAACEALLASHVSLVGSGDCGKWDAEKEDEVVAARAAIAAARAEAGL